MKTKLYLALFGALVGTNWVTSNHGAAKAVPATTLNQVQTVWYRSARGDAYFTARLEDELVGDGLVFVSNPRQADAILDSAGIYDGNFYRGKFALYGLNGRVLLSQGYVVPDAAHLAAQQRVAQQARAHRR